MMAHVFLDLHHQEMSILFWRVQKLSRVANISEIGSEATLDKDHQIFALRMENLIVQIIWEGFE